MTQNATELKNIQAIIGLERNTRENRSALDRTVDAVSKAASSPAFIVAHVLWFGVWIGLNVHRASFDPFPFNLLTLAVSLEAIVLTGFVLMAQSRMTQQADRRAHLDLQINLLAEQELTAILKLQCLLAERAGIDVASSDHRLEHLIAQTDVSRLAAALEHELAADGRADSSTLPATAVDAVPTIPVARS